LTTIVWDEMSTLAISLAAKAETDDIGRSEKARSPAMISFCMISSPVAQLLFKKPTTTLDR
jgi:hypothetical protein